jgi:glycosyltransferase involved in cell wall biosynthesis
MNPKFSVVIPTYNQASFLGKAIESVLNQTYKNWELIVVDNYSTDNTFEVVKSFNSEKIRFFQINNDGIISKSRNKGIIESLGNFIAFLDSDDFWYHNKLEVINEYLISDSDISFVCHAELWSYLSNSKKNKLVRYGPQNKSRYYSMLFNGNCISTSAVVVSKKCLTDVGLFSESPLLITSEDYDLWLKISEHGYKMYFLNDVLGQYLIHSLSNSNATDRNVKAILECFNQHYLRNNFSGVYFTLMKNRRIASIHYVGARGFLENNFIAESFQSHIISIKNWPFQVKIYISLVQLFTRIIFSYVSK